MYQPEMTKNDDSLGVLQDDFVNKRSFQNLYVAWSVSVKSSVTFEKCLFVEELKLKNLRVYNFFTLFFSISPPEGVCELFSFMGHSSKTLLTDYIPVYR